MPQVVLPYPPQDREQLWWAVKAIFGVSIPRTQVCPDHCAPFTAFADAYFRECTLPGYEGDMSRAIWLASRGLAGKSFTLATLGLFFAYVVGADITILGGSLAQSNNVHQYMTKAIEFEGIPGGMMIDSTATRTTLTNSGRIRPLPASQRNVRGPHPSILLIDEADEMELEIYDAALGQPLPQKNYLDQTVDTLVVVSSTWQNPDGTLTEILRRAEAKHQPVYNWCIAAGAQVTTRRGLVSIERVRSDDQVLTRAGWRAVQHVTLMGHKETVTLRTAGGHALACTPDHLVSTSTGWRPAGSLHPGDRLQVIDALPAVATAVGGSVGVRGVVGVPMRALGAGHLVADDLAPLDVQPAGDHVEVAAQRVAAGVDFAEVVDGQAGRYVDAGQAHGQAMGQLLAPRVGGAADLAVSGRVASETPYPATVLVNGDALPDVIEVHVESVTAGAIAPVYDIGVEGEHEFVANGIVVHNCYKESANPVDGWLGQKTIEEKRESVSAEMWRTEYDLGEPSIGNRAFDSDAVEKAFSLKFAPNDPIGTGKGYIEHKLMKDFEEYRFARRVNAGQYVAGADWAKEKDKTVVWVARVDGPQRELVYFLRLNRRPYPQMIGYLNKAISYYRVPLKGVWHDSTGLGNVVNDYLDVRAKPFPMTGDKRAILLSDYVNAVEKGMWKIPRIPSTYMEHKYAQVGDLYSSATTKFHLPDTVCAAALAEYAAKRYAGAGGAPVVVTRTSEPTKLERNFAETPDPVKSELSPDSNPLFSLVVD
jgi:hypothetical protein